MTANHWSRTAILRGHQSITGGTHHPSIHPSIQGYLESQITWEYAKSRKNLIRCSVKKSRVFFFTRHGVPQVFVPAPLLFNIYLEAYSLILCYHGEFFRFTLMTVASPSLLSEKPHPTSFHFSPFPLHASLLFSSIAPGILKSLHTHLTIQHYWIIQIIPHSS